MAGAAALNEGILSSVSEKNVAAHPWHDLEIGTKTLVLHHFFLSFCYTCFIDYGIVTFPFPGLLMVLSL
jgi:hypothetical protein